MLRERRPRGTAWEEIPVPDVLGYFNDTIRAVSMWESRRVRVISALEAAELPDKSGVGPQWHLSVTRGGLRPRAEDVERVLTAFGMRGAEEDNHHPGNARHFWMPVDADHRVDCQCKAEEEFLDDDGYPWTNPREGSCRGCEIAPVTGRPCPLHGVEGR